VFYIQTIAIIDCLYVILHFLVMSYTLIDYMRTLVSAWVLRAQVAKEWSCSHIVLLGVFIIVCCVVICYVILCTLCDILLGYDVLLYLNYP
jgi:hypothetical protein